MKPTRRRPSPTGTRSQAKGKLYWTTLETQRLGEVFLAATEKGVCAVEFPGERGLVPSVLASEIPRKKNLEPVESADRLAAATRSLREWSEGKAPRRPVRIDLRFVGSFDARVLLATAGIPWGRTASYGEIARRIGRPKAARAVGGALGRNPVPLFVPCHRVVAGNGGLGGFTGSIERKKALLEIESARGAGLGGWPRGPLARSAALDRSGGG